MLTKKQVLSVIKNMPDNFDITELFDRILLINKIEEGRQQIKDGKGMSTENAEYTGAFKIELNRRITFYRNESKMVTPTEVNKRITAVRKNRKKKKAGRAL